MSNKRYYLAVDLGAESGRVILGAFDGKRLDLQPVHRFPNGPVQVHDTLYWDALRIFSEIKTGLARGVAEAGSPPASAGVDTWGVDFGLLDRQGRLLCNPVHYRDARTNGMMEEAFRRVPREEIFQRTGIQFMQLNTLYQLLALSVQSSPALSVADRLLFMPDLFNYWLTGQMVNERTIASTSQLLNPAAPEWEAELIQKLDLPLRIFGPLVEPGSVLGPLRAELAEEIGAAGLQMVAPGCHDTACAVAAVPAEGRNHAFLSSGTWSLMGAEVDHPVINERTAAANFTNEGGVCGTIRLLHNIIGLWLVQECRRTWARSGQDVDYVELARMAEESPAFVALVNPSDPVFLAPGDMPARIREYCQRTGQPEPVGRGGMVRTALESLALTYRRTLQQLEEILGRKLERIHIVGGGSQNRVLNQLTADATGQPVVAGPVEATAAGNILMQMLAMGHIGSLDEARALVRASFAPEIFEPRSAEGWEAAYDRFLALPT